MVEQFQAGFDRTVYSVNPLAEVVCQIKFPYLLSIDASPPATFQEKLRDVYPHLEFEQVVEIGVPGDVRRAIQSTRSYVFLSADRAWRVVLNGGFVAIVTTSYLRWEDFRERLDKLVRLLIEIYGVTKFTRVGLRYQNVVDRERLGLQGVPWSQLLRPAVTGWLAEEAPFSEAQTSGYNSTATFHGEGYRLNVLSALVERADSSDRAFLLDADFYLEEPEIELGGEILHHVDRLHDLTGPFFRWCITGELHKALGPQSVSGE